MEDKEKQVMCNAKAAGAALWQARLLLDAVRDEVERNANASTVKVCSDVAHAVVYLADTPCKYSGYLTSGCFRVETGTYESPALVLQELGSRLERVAGELMLDLSGSYVQARHAAPEPDQSPLVFRYMSAHEGRLRIEVELLWNSLRDVKGVRCRLVHGFLVSGVDSLQDLFGLIDNSTSTELKSLVDRKAIATQVKHAAERITDAPWPAGCQPGLVRDVDKALDNA